MYSSTILTTLLTAALAIQGIAAGPCRAATPTYTCRALPISRRSKLCSAQRHLQNVSYRLQRQSGLDWEQCAALCAATEGCTMITSDSDDYCNIWSGTREEAGITSTNDPDEYLSEMACFSCTLGSGEQTGDA